MLNSNKPKYLLRGILILAILLFVANKYWQIATTVLTERVGLLGTVFLILTVMFSTVYARRKTLVWFRGALIVSSIFLLLNLVLSVEVVAMQVYARQMSEIATINSCEEAERQFTPTGWMCTSWVALLIHLSNATISL